MATVPGQDFQYEVTGYNNDGFRVIQAKQEPIARVATVEEIQDSDIETAVNAAEKRIRKNDGSYVMKDAEPSQSMGPEMRLSAQTTDQDVKRWKERLQRTVGDKNVAISLLDLISEVPAAGLGLLELAKESVERQQGIEEVVDLETATKRVIRSMRTRPKDDESIYPGTVNLVRTSTKQPEASMEGLPAVLDRTPD